MQEIYLGLTCVCEIIPEAIYTLRFRLKLKQIYDNVIDISSLKAGNMPLILSTIILKQWSINILVALQGHTK